LLDCETYRIEGHYYGDAMAYRTKEETEEWRKKDPILRAEMKLIERKVLSAVDCKDIYRQILTEVEEAVAFAESSPEPGMESIYEDIYTGEIL
jgi:TPP-dependent pyruvate/acetoin dehydrogenase alpha subunit